MDDRGPVLAHSELLRAEFACITDRRAAAFADELDAEMRDRIDTSSKDQPNQSSPGSPDEPSGRLKRWGWWRRSAAAVDSQTQSAEEVQHAKRVLLAEAKLAEEPKLTGLALSGGGIRSASFNLGLLQALYAHGVLRHIDYLSTVSGGGYVGSFLTSLVHRRQCEQSSIDWRPTGPSTGTKRPLEILPDSAGKQPPKVDRLLFGGLQLREPLMFLNHYIGGLLLINLAVLSALIFLCMTLAYLFRCLDYRDVIIALDVAGFEGDLARAFVPSAAVFILWILGRLVMSFVSALAATFSRTAERLHGALGRMRMGRLTTIGASICQGMLLLSGVLLVVGFVAVLSTGDLAIGDTSPISSLRPIAEQVSANKDELKLVVLGMLVMAILPYVRLRELIRSGTRPRGAVESWIFAIASRALLYGVPLVIFAVCVQENISGYIGLPARKDSHALTFMHIADWESFWRMVRGEAKSSQQSDPSQAPATPGAALWQAANYAMSYDATGDRLSNAGAVGNTRKSPFDANSDLSPVEQSLLDGDIPPTLRFWELPWRYDDFKRAYSDRQHRESQKKAIMAAVNDDALKRRKLYRAFESVTHDDRLDEEQRRELSRLLPLAQANEQRLNENDSRHSDRQELQRLNRKLMAAYYGERIRDESTVFAFVVQKPDQQFRWWWMGFSLVVALASGAFVNLNLTSIHRYYRDRLAGLWIESDRQRHARIPLDAIQTTRAGAPYHLINAALNFFGRRPSKDIAREPTGLFLFSPLAVGSEQTGYRRSAKYPTLGHKPDLAEAMAISGAAVSPTVVGNPLLAALMFVLNWRTGWWFSNAFRVREYATAAQGSSPNGSDVRRGWRNRALRVRDFVADYGWPTPLATLIESWVLAPEDRAYRFVTDGGHYENLGLEALLQRRCRIIIASDVSQDPEYDFVDLLRVVRRARAIFGIRFYDLAGDDPWNLDLLVPDRAHRLAERHYVVARIRYPEVENWHPAANVKEGFLVYIKPTLTGDEDLELLRYRNENQTFPHDPTLDQFYDPRRFECYRQLGHCIGEQLGRDLDNWSAQLDMTGGLATWNPADHSAPDPNCLTPELLVRLGLELDGDDDFNRIHAARELSDRGAWSQLSLRRRVAQLLDRRLRKEEDAVIRGVLCDALQSLRRRGLRAAHEDGTPSTSAVS